VREAAGGRRRGAPAKPTEEETMPRVIDLTVPFKTGMAGIPKIPFYDEYPVKVQAVTFIDADQRQVLAREGVDVMDSAAPTGVMNTVLTLNSHVGTHIDAPRHFLSDGAPVDMLPLERLVSVRAVVLDVSDTVPGEPVTADALERTGVKPGPGEVAVIKTLWTDRAWGKAEFWGNMIWLDPSVGEWTSGRGLAAVGMDCFPEIPFWRIALKPNERGINHRRWLGAGIPMIQMLTNLGHIASRFTLTALPLRLEGMDGSPARVVGIED
jgi:kynurenine formamidase